jgi:hypothetical protein
LRSDLTAREPQRLAEMSKQLRRLFDDVRAESPVWPAWTWPRTERQRIEWPAYRKKAVPQGSSSPPMKSEK